MRKDLLVYCKQDTLAMVRLHESLLAMCRGCLESGGIMAHVAPVTSI